MFSGFCYVIDIKHYRFFKPCTLFLTCSFQKKVSLLQSTPSQPTKGYTLITFVGTGRRFLTPYTWEGQLCETEHFVEALLQFMPIDKVLLFVTPQAQEHENFALAKAVINEAHKDYKVIEIPNGSQPEEYWKIFDALTQNAGDAEIVFDITHGFRSLPMLGFLACVYLKSLGKNNIAHLVYGNYEAKEANNGQAPVYDLTPFLSLLDWIEASNQLVDTGSSYRLAKLMNKIQEQAYRQKKKGSNQELPQELGRAAKILESISASLLLAQPELLHTQIKALQEKLPAVAKESQSWARPVLGLLQNIENTYSPFQVNDLETQRELIYWYLERGHHTQAITLGKEWLSSYMCQHILKNAFPPKIDRDRIENAVNYWRCLKDKKQSPLETASEEAKQAYAHPSFDTFFKLWMSLTEHRNTIAHCGMGRENGQKALSLESSLKKSLKDLQHLPL